MNDEDQQAMEEARYWFCLNEVVDYVHYFGAQKVVDDILELADMRKEIEDKRKQPQEFDDVPF